MSVSELSAQYASYQGDIDDEYVRIDVEEECWLDDFLVMDNTYNENGGVSNKYRHVYHFPFEKVYPGDKIKLYTKEGRNSIPYYTGINRTISLYWGLGKSIWNKDGDIIHLIKIAASESKEVI